jgi:NADH-quinone oxidoreductase subunit F
VSPETGTSPITETRILLRHAGDPDLRKLETYKSYGGYATQEKAYRELDIDWIVNELEESGLRGRGGAGFPMGKKVSFLPHGDQAKYLCCNADESEPGAFKDRELMQRNPHQLIEGIAISSIAGDIGHAFIFIRGEYDKQGDILDEAVAEAYAAGYLGVNILGSGHDLELVVHRGAGAYICGEETALLDALEGKRGNPRLKPPFPAVQGLYGGPTLINNVETLSNVPHVIANGADWFKSFGTEQSPGTKVVSVSGCVKRPGNYEVELGVKTRDLIYGLAGGPLDGREIKAFYPGGSSSPVLEPKDLDLPYSFEAMAEAGSMLGSGSIIVADDSVSIPHMALRTARFYHHESCGKCTPCREGTNWTVKMLERVVRGEATPMDLDIISSVQKNIMGHCLCVLGDSMAMPVSAMVNKFREEFEEVIASAAMAGFPTDVGREAQIDGSGFDGEDPGPGGTSPKTIERERLVGRSLPAGAQEVSEH